LIFRDGIDIAQDSARLAHVFRHKADARE